MTSDFKVGRNDPKKSDVLGLKRVGRSKISENRRTSLMDVHLLRLDFSGEKIKRRCVI